MKSIATFAALAATLLAASPAGAATPAAGVEQKLASGFFADVNIGGFSTMMGKGSDGASQPFSNMQFYLQLGVGYDISQLMSLGLVFGLGASGASCFSQVDKKGNCVVDPVADKTPIADNFTATTIAAELTFKIPLSERLKVMPRLRVGYAMLDPEPRQGVTWAVPVGLAVGVEYATHMDHFSIGADVHGGLFAMPNIGYIALYPKIKYTF